MARFFHTGAVWPVEARAHFGTAAPVVFGWVSAAHQVGAGSVAYVGGAVRDVFGTYDMVWVGAGVLCAVAALGALVIGRGEPGAGGASGDPRQAASADPHEPVSPTPTRTAHPHRAYSPDHC
ncbi:hypothetical protein [Streptomyces sp. NBC_00499]|uniref:hypothetical protein n=1 Tax=unclassified Streptomyces TaxID=2593676 RepID=UPI00386BBEE9